MRYRIIPVTPFQQNCSLVWCENTGDAALIDPGGEVDRLLAAVEEEQVSLRQIWLTHGHLDHVGGTAELVRRLALPVIGPGKDDSFWLDALDAQVQMMGFEPVEGFVPDRWLAEGDRLHLGEQEFEVYHCPGHTPGHVVLFHRGQKLAFVGDVLFNGSIGRTDFPRGDHGALISAIREKLLPLGDDVQFVPGHGPMSTFGEERRHNPFVADTRFG